MSQADVTQDSAAGRRVHVQQLVNIAFVVFVLCGAIAFIEPSPYDFASLICIPLWFLAGFRIHWSFVVFAAMLLVYNFAGFLALVPYWHETGPAMFMFQSFYLLVTVLFFALFFGERTNERAELCLKAFTASNVIAALAGLAGYLDIAGLSSLFMNGSRAQGTFKDPNVLGSFVIPGALYCMHLLMMRRTTRVFLTIGTLLLLLSAIFLSFSRGSWLAFILSTGLMLAITFAATPDSRQRRRILIGACTTLGAAVLLIAVLMSIPSLREFFFQRAQGVGEEYADPRFFNQLRSLPMMLELPLGFGPLRFRNVFDLEPHSSFVNGFASYGWLGGFMFLLIVGTTTFIGFRLCFANSPYRHFAQVYWPALFGFFIQGFQIDIDHWRHVFLLLGAVWGLETARLRWMEAKGREIRTQAARLRPTPATAQNEFS
jgi:hypothetical protein